jgi:hypothetical protein
MDPITYNISDAVIKEGATFIFGSSSAAPRRRLLVVGTPSVRAQRQDLLARAAQQLVGFSSPVPRRRHFTCVRPATSSTRAGGAAPHQLLVAFSSSSAPRLCAPSDEIYSRGRRSTSPAPRCCSLGHDIKPILQFGQQQKS